MCFGGGKKASSDSGQATGGGTTTSGGTTSGGGSTTTTTTGNTSSSTTLTGSGPGGREKTTDEFYAEMKPGPFELPSLGTGEAPVTRAPIAYGTITPVQRPGLPQRSLLIPFIRPVLSLGAFKKSGG